MAATLKVLALLFAVMAAVSAQHGHHEEYHHHPKYEFKYAVHDDKTHDIKSHSEHRDGDKTEGEYSLVEPDGTTRTVKYHVHGKSGFVATVHRSGHATHPQVHHAPQHHHEQPQQQQQHGHHAPATAYQTYTQYHHGHHGSAGF